jgi:hypothetical protein
VRVWNGFVSLKIGSSDELLWSCTKASVSVKCEKCLNRLSNYQLLKDYATFKPLKYGILLSNISKLSFCLIENIISPLHRLVNSLQEKNGHLFGAYYKIHR